MKRNPFIAGSWVRGVHFFGRQRLIEEILQGPRHALWVAGMRRIGKTSLLKQIEFLTEQPEYRSRCISLYWDMQGGRNLDGFTELFLESLEDASGRLDRIGLSPADVEGASLFEMLRRLRHRARQHKLQLILLCDEAEELINLQKSNPAALDRLRRALQQGDGQKTVVTATKRLLVLEQGQRTDTSPFLHGFIPPLYLSQLEVQEAKALAAAGRFPANIVARILLKTNRHPFLLQLLCSRLFEAPDEPLDAVVENLSTDEMLSQFFAVDFACLDANEKSILWHVLAEKQTDTAALQRKTTLRAGDVSQIINSLIHFGYLRREKEAVRIANYFFEQWLARQKDELPPGQRAAGGRVATETTVLDVRQGSCIAHYEVLEKVGEGGMGAVYRARDLQLAREVALKFLLPGARASAVTLQRFSREAQAASALNHPGIATIFAIEEIDGQPFISMEYIDGESLTEWAGGAGTKYSARLAMAIRLAEAFAHAHSRNVIHRDIKPENILITREGDPKITDFGLAKVLDRAGDALTKTGSTLGTIAYMSPEQATGSEIDPRSDIFSFGVVLYELFTGRLPFAGDTQVARLHALLHETPAPARIHVPDLPLELERLLEHMLQKDPAARCASMLEVQSALEALPGR